MIDLVSYGRPAREALAKRILAEKGGNTLAPVTVIVPSNYAGLSVRRALAAASPVVNVRFMGLGRFAELLGAPALSAEGKRPLTPWVRIQAVHAALKRRPGVFAEVASHPATARELQSTFAELREVTPQARAILASSGARPADVIALYDEFRTLTGAYFDETDLLEEAAKSLKAGSTAAHESGSLILYLPRKLPRPLRELLMQAVTNGGQAHAIIGLTGDPEADELAASMAQALAALSPVGQEETHLPSVNRVVSTTDAEEEVREAIRQTMALVASGTPLHRVAFAYASKETYAGLLDDALNSAEVPHNSTPNRTLVQTIAGRTVLGLLRIPASSGPGDPGYAREVVMDWLTGAPIHHGTREAPSHRWDEISRDAGVVRGPGQWVARLETYAANQDLEARERASGEDSTFRRNARWARELRDFMVGLQAKLGGDATARHGAHAGQALGWLKDFLPESALGDDEDQLDARERVKRTLEEIVALGAELPPEMDPMVKRAEFANALEEALEQPFGRQGKLGEGVFCGNIRNIGEMEFDALVVLGMVEGAFPAATHDDPILTAEERARTGGELPPGGESPSERRRTYLAALCAAEQARMVSAPRADIRRQRATQPSRWLLDAASQLHGERLYSSELEAMLPSPPAWFRVVNSFESALRTAPERASIQEWDLASLLRYQGRLDRHFFFRRDTGPNPLRRGLDARRSRSKRGERQLDGWIGKVPPGAAPVPGVERAISPTALETYAKCPFRYFLGNVLKVGEVERPEEVVTIEPATIGSIVHEILQHFFEAMKDRPDPFADWSGDERETLKTLASRSFEEAERRGQTGKALTWRAEQKRILRDLELLLDRELRQRRLEGFKFKAAEAAFGTDARASRPEPMPPVRFELADGQVVTFRGVVDRIDEGPAGELLITDYKTGSMRTYEDMKDDDPMKGGKFLQLPVYALAFRDQSAAPVRARYWFISEQADFASKEILLDDGAYRKFGGIVNTLVATMREGYFPAVPGLETYRPGRDTHENCAYCPYDLLCQSTSRLESWESAKTDPGLAAFAALGSGEGAEDAGND